MSIIFVGDTAVHYEALGHGRPVLFLHTWVGTWRYWVPSMQRASASHGTYALDLLGFGHTGRSVQWHGIDTQVDLVEGFLNEMGIDRVALVGHGLGALVGLQLAARDSSRIVRLLAISLPVQGDAVRARIRASGASRLFAELAGRWADTEELAPAASPAQSDALADTFDPETMRTSMQALDKASIPGLLVWGGADPLLDAATANSLTAASERLGALIMDGAGHFPMLDAPEGFHRLMIDFLAMEPGAIPRQLGLREEWRRRIR